MAKNRSRRLRKTLYSDELTVYGFEITCQMAEHSESDYDKFIDEFVDLIESKNLVFGGGSAHKQFSCFVVSNGRYDSPTEKDRIIVENWLSNNSILTDVKVGELVDANNDI